MVASGNLGAQAVLAFDIGLGLAVQDQRQWRIQWRPADHLAVDQPVQQVLSRWNAHQRLSLENSMFHSDFQSDIAHVTCQFVSVLHPADQPFV